jgi:hypothetical protein
MKDNDQRESRIAGYELAAAEATEAEEMSQKVGSVGKKARWGGNKRY